MVVTRRQSLELRLKQNPKKKIEHSSSARSINNAEHHNSTKNQTSSIISQESREPFYVGSKHSSSSMGSVEFTTQSSEPQEEVQIHNFLDTNLDKEQSAQASVIRDASSTNKLEKDKRKSRLKRILRTLFYLFAFLVAFLLVFFSQGISLLLKYRHSFGNKAPIPFSPVHGVVAVFDKHDEIEAIDGSNLFATIDDDDDANKELKKYDGDYMFKTFHASALNESLSKKPLRLLFLGDSIARGVGSSVPYPYLPESTAKTISKLSGGRPVYWSVIAEPGCTIKWMTMHVSKLRNQGNFGSDDTVLNDLLHHHWSELYRTGEKISSTARGKVHWIERLQHHQELQRLNPFAGYDIIVILSGVNDIKRVLVPFLFSGDDESRWIHRDGEERGFGGDLKRLVNRLNVTMFGSLGTTPENSSTCSLDSGLPRFILPSFPAKQVPAKMGFVLKFIGIQSTKLLDSAKRQIADQLGNQIFAPPEMMTEHGIDYINKQGQIWNVLKEEDVKLQLISIGEEQSYNLTQQMVEFYKNNHAEKNDMPWNPLMSNDSLHPNEHGYDAAGRMIGIEVTNRWDFKSKTYISGI